MCVNPHMADTTAALVKSLRKRLGLTQEDVAARAAEGDPEFRRDYVTKVETGANKASSQRVRVGLVAAFPDVPPARVILRAAWVCGRPVAVHRHGERLVWAPEGMPVPERGDFWERRLVRRVRATGDWQASVFGMEAIPLGETGDEGVVVFLPDAEVAVGW